MPNITAAAVQFAPNLGDVTGNRARICHLLHEAAAAGARLVVFPEAAISGYSFDSLKDARRAAEPLRGPTAIELAKHCRSLRVYSVLGFLEADGEKLFNSAMLVGPDGVIGCYRKAHLPHLGVDRFTNPGDTGFAVFETSFGNIGMMICYDQRFPEAARCLSLAGADILAMPTNWPVGAESASTLLIPARALENRCYIVAANRVGSEGRITYIGGSVIVEPSGVVIARGGTKEESILLAAFDPLLARQKKIIVTLGEYEMDTLGDRRPDLYAKISESRTRNRIA